MNLGGAQRLVRAFGAGMVARRRGDLVFVTSDVVAHPRPRMAAYVASKWGLEGFVTALQMELEGTGVRAIVVRPGPTLTGMGMDWDPEVTADVLAEWTRWGVARHSAFLRPDGVALGHRARRGGTAGDAPERRRGPARSPARRAEVTSRRADVRVWRVEGSEL